MTAIRGESLVEDIGARKRCQCHIVANSPKLRREGGVSSKITKRRAGV